MNRPPDLGRRTEINEYSSAMRQLGIWLTLPILLAAAPLTGLFIGQWIDRYCRSEPWAAVLFTALGLVAGAREARRLVQIAQRMQENDSTRHK